MRLAEYTDYTLRVLMYCAANPDRLVTIQEIADAHRVSKNHLMKIVNELAQRGVLRTTRGRRGGVQLMKPPERIRIGEVVRAAESDFRMVECFDPQFDECVISDSCRLRGLLDRALVAYMRELDGATLADIAKPLPVRGRVTIPIKAIARAPRQRA